MNLRDRLLTFTLGAFVATGILALPGVHLPWLRLLVGAPLVLLLPGYCLAVAVDPTQRLGRAETMTIAIGGSIALTALVGLVLASLGVRLTEAAWLVWLGALTFVEALVAEWRVGRHAAEQPPDAPPLLVPLVAAVLALGCFSAAIVGLTGSFHLRSATGQVLQLWALPEPSSADTKVQVGVANLVSGTPFYHLRVTQQGAVIFQTSFNLPKGSTRTFVIRRSAASTSPVRAVLTKVADNKPLRSVWLLPPKPAEGR